MTAKQQQQPKRCAIYTRKSTEHGLDLEFNSLDAQREACEAYIKSQAHEGWRLIPKHYDDGAFSGASLNRPAVQELLADIKTGLVDVIVVYKIDRLTRSLADFAKLVEVFDEKNVSFVAVTQHFNTTSSMGRLTLNVLLSFAQFERELSSERVRDKVAASRRKGIWTGGGVPLGYDAVDKKLKVNPAEANSVRTIFERYVELKSIHLLKQDIDARGIVSKRRKTKNGKSNGGVRMIYGALAHLLKNRFYLGEIGHNRQWYPGEHEAIVDRIIFDQVQEIMKANGVSRRQKLADNGALLASLVYDDRGNRMTPTFTTKNTVRYRFYVSTALLSGRKDETGSLPRISGPDLEAAVLTTIRNKTEVPSDAEPEFIISKYVERVEVGRNKLRLELKELGNSSRTLAGGEAEGDTVDATAAKEHIDIQLKPNPKGPLARVDESHSAQNEPDPTLVQAVARAHGWVRQLLEGEYTSVESLAKAVNMHPKVIRKGLRLAFLAPEIIKSVLGRSSRLIISLSDVHAAHSLSWASQRRSVQARPQRPR
jgi:site-specific DNA recombinase